jgi:hypothetical protein
MSPSIPDQLAALALGESARIRGVRVVRRSLFGFQVAGGKELLPAAAAAARIATAVKGTRTAARVAVCFRCAGDGLGRRDRGRCGVCRGRGILVVEPAVGWAETPPAQITAAADQATLALRGAHHPRARDALIALLTDLSRGTGVPQVDQGGLGGALGPHHRDPSPRCASAA